MKVRMSVLLLALIVGAGPSIRSAEGVGSDKGLAARSSLHALNAFAITARDHSARSIQLLTDEIIDRMCPVDLPQGHSLRVRVFRAEQAFRLGRHAAIPEDRLADTINSLADQAGAPTWSKTSITQLRLFRTALKPHVPQLIETKADGRNPFEVSNELSPAEALLVTLFLTNGKLFNPEYQVDPETWVERVRQTRVTRSRDNVDHGGRPLARLVGRIERPEVMRALSSLEAGLQDETSDETRQAHQFLDSLGLAK